MSSPLRAARCAWLAALIGCCLACSEKHDESSFYALYEPPEPNPEQNFRVPPPPFSEEGVFPCSDCHDPELPVNQSRRQLEMAHSEIELRHDEQNRWCLDCHDAGSRDQLRLASGVLIEFEESYRLCGQCHGDKYRDWRAGVHGRRSGNWDGEKTYLLCVHCHDSHAPQFKPIEPMPVPIKPVRTR